MARLKVGIIFGGCSEEHPISVKSAQEVARHLDTEKYEPFYIGITTSGAWKLCDGPDADWENGSCRPAVLSPDRSVARIARPGAGTATRRSASTWCCPSCTASSARTARCRACWSSPASPTSGCDVQSSALCMDKSLAYIVARSAGIATPNFWTVTANEDVDPDQLTYPVFVKPARSGSSFGVSKVARSGRTAERGGGRAAVRLEGADRGGRRRQRGRLRHPGRTIRT